MTKKPNRQDANPELERAEERIEATKAEIAQALIQRNTLPSSASDEERAAAVSRVEQLQAQHHEAVQYVLAVKRAATTKLEREHKDKKLHHKRLKASRRPGGPAAPHEEPSTPRSHTSIHAPMDRAAAEAEMDAANEEDMLLERQRLEEEERAGADEAAHELGKLVAKRAAEEAVVRREAKKRGQQEAKTKAETARIKAEKEARGKVRQQAALRRAKETTAEKHRQGADREARQRAARDAKTSGWFSEVLRRVKTMFRGSR